MGCLYYKIIISSVSQTIHLLLEIGLHLFNNFWSTLTVTLKIIRSCRLWTVVKKIYEKCIIILIRNV